MAMSTSTSTASTKMSTATTLPRIGLGMAALGRPGYINLDRENDKTGVGTAAIRTVEHMRNLADNVMGCVMETDANTFSTYNTTANTKTNAWFDCARSYGKSEEFVGTFLRTKKIAPSDVYVSSKWGYEYVADWKVSLEKGEPHEIKDHSIDMFLKQLQETKKYVGEYIDLYQIHSATFESGVLTNTEVHKALHQCRKELGWKIGLSVSSPKQNETLLEAMKICVDGETLFDSVQCTYNLLEQKPGEALLKAHEAGMDIIIKEGMANGRLLNHVVLKDLCQRAKMLPAFSSLSSDLTPDQLALGAILAQPFRPRVLSGAVTCEQYQSNHKALKVADIFEKEHPELLKELMKECELDSNKYWEDRSALAWN